ncbi:amidohydrolase family protein [Sandarakinorhabdus sp.]|uniref:metal-dependent hydrolase family protein n=1 Tax=Sandarakinorhabdus sp. TaxID=1916663 RepID=UPI00286E887C|nr:amidohydrolase family protein [Sandarakinorhabdus sp.]
MRIIVGLLLGAAIAAPLHAETFAIKAGRVITDAAQPARGPSTVIVTDGRITAINDAAAPIPAGAVIIDQSARTLAPGLIDAHVHLTGDPGTPFWREAVDTDEKAVAVGLKNAALTVRAGFTTVRDLGSSRLTAFAVRDAITEGMFPGPRIVASGPAISIIGGHGDVSGYRPEVNAVLGQGNTCTGPDQCAARVREASQRGADVIKITATGGVLSQQGRGLGQHFTDAEMLSIVTTAHGLGLKVAAHAHGARGIEAAARAGVDSIEHGTFADDAAIKAMVASGSWYVPTLMALVGIDERLGKGVFTATVEKKVRETLALRGKALAAATRAGVKVAFGTDTGVSEHGRNGGEGAEMVKYAGMSPRAVLVSATSAAADLLGISGETGTLAPGKAADIIAMDGDPLADAGQLARVKWVMARGRVID